MSKEVDEIRRKYLQLKFECCSIINPLDKEASREKVSQFLEWLDWYLRNSNGQSSSK